MNSLTPSHLAHRPLSILPLQFPHVVADVLHLISDHRCSALKLDRLDEYVEKVSMYNCLSADTEQSGLYCREQRSETLDLPRHPGSLATKREGVQEYKGPPGLSNLMLHARVRLPEETSEASALPSRSCRFVFPPGSSAQWPQRQWPPSSTPGCHSPTGSEAAWSPSAAGEPTSHRPTPQSLGPPAYP